MEDKPINGLVTTHRQREWQGVSATAKQWYNDSNGSVVLALHRNVVYMSHTVTSTLFTNRLNLTFTIRRHIDVCNIHTHHQQQILFLGIRTIKTSIS